MIVTLEDIEKVQKQLDRLKARCVDEDQFKELKNRVTEEWYYEPKPSFSAIHYYRVKPKEPVYEWQWILLTDGFISDKTLDYHTKYVNGWTKFEPSKRIRK